MNRVVFDTNVLVDWINSGLHEAQILQPGRVRLLSSVVEMELRAGIVSKKAQRVVNSVVAAHVKSARILCPTPSIFREAGELLRKLSKKGSEIRRASFVNDVLLAVSVRSIGATLVTRDRDFERIQNSYKFSVEFLS